jgi:hypothetical protein
VPRAYKWEVPLRALRSLTDEHSSNPEGSGRRKWFSSAEISDKSESLCRWEVSQRAVAVAMNRHKSKGLVEGRRVRQQTFSQAKVEVWEWKLLTEE